MNDSSSGSTLMMMSGLVSPAHGERGAAESAVWLLGFQPWHTPTSSTGSAQLDTPAVSPQPLDPLTSSGVLGHVPLPGARAMIAERLVLILAFDDGLRFDTCEGKAQPTRGLARGQTDHMGCPHVLPVASALSSQELPKHRPVLGRPVAWEMGWVPQPQHRGTQNTQTREEEPLFLQERISSYQTALGKATGAWMSPGMSRRATRTGQGLDRGVLPSSQPSPPPALW